jgi:hypothetical protein
MNIREIYATIIPFEKEIIELDKTFDVKKACCGHTREENFARKVHDYIFSRTVDKTALLQGYDVLKEFKRALTVKSPLMVQSPPEDMLIRTPNMAYECEECTRKHLASALALMTEILDGYAKTDHEQRLMGQLDQAEEHSIGLIYNITPNIRALRRDIFVTRKEVTLMHMQWCKNIYAKMGNILTNARQITK